MAAIFTISAFGDEITPDLEEQLTTLNELGIGWLDLRRAWGKNLQQLDNDDLAQVVKVCNAHNVRVSCLGSFIGKSPLEEPLDHEINNLTRIFEVGKIVGCHRVRLMSFYKPDTSTYAHEDAYVEIATSRLAKLTEMAVREGFVLLLENEGGYVTDTLVHCEAIIKAINSSALRFLWDAANFIRVGEEHVVERGWPMVGDLIGYVHIKDAVRSDGHIVPAGEGDGQLPMLLKNLIESGYHGFLAVEPHLKIAGYSNGFSGAYGMTMAVTALRKIMAETGCIEMKG